LILIIRGESRGCDIEMQLSCRGKLTCRSHKSHIFFFELLKSLQIINR